MTNIIIRAFLICTHAFINSQQSIAETMKPTVNLTICVIIVETIFIKTIHVLVWALSICIEKRVQIPDGSHSKVDERSLRNEKQNLGYLRSVPAACD